MTVKVDGAKLKIRDVVRVARGEARAAYEQAALDPAGARADRGDPGLYRPDLDA